jgi:hypothetical protein
MWQGTYFSRLMELFVRCDVDTKARKCGWKRWRGIGPWSAEH